MTMQKDPEERKEEIILTAKKLFAERGYKATQIKDIVSEIGLSQGLFYYYFKSKEEVMEAVAENYADEIINQISNLVKSSGKCRDRLFQIFNIFIETANTESIIFTEIQTAANGIIHDKVFKLLGQKLIPLVVKIVNDGNVSHEFNCLYPEQSSLVVVNGILDILNNIPNENRIEYLQDNLNVFQYILIKIYGIGEQG